MKTSKYVTIHKAVFMLLGFFIIVLVASVVSSAGLFGLTKFAQTSPSQQQGEIKEFLNENGYVEIKPTGDKKVFTKGAQESLDINISHPDKQTVGFNVPIEYDPVKFEFEGVEVTDARFNLYVRREGANNIVLVAVQQATNTDRITLYKQTVARVFFKAVSGGAGRFQILDTTPKGYKLKLINEKNDVSEPSFGTLQIGVK